MKYCFALLLSIRFCFAQQDSMQTNNRWYRTNLQHSLNPAFTGDNGKLSISNHTQFNLYEPNLSTAFYSNNISVQSAFKNFGVGLNFINTNNAGFGKDYSAGLSLSFKITINRNNAILVGAAGSLNQSSIDFSKLTFFDQYNFYGGPVSLTSQMPPTNNVFFANSTIGIIYKNSKGFVSISMQNINEPVIAFYSVKSSPNSVLNRNFLFDAGWKIYELNKFKFFGNFHININNASDNISKALFGIQTSYNNKFIAGIHLSTLSGTSSLLAYHHAKFRIFIQYNKEYVFAKTSYSNEGILFTGFNYNIIK